MILNNTDGFVGYDRLGNRNYWIDNNEFHIKKSVIEEEIIICNKLKFLPVTITDSFGNVVNDGIGLFNVVGGDS